MIRNRNFFENINVEEWIEPEVIEEGGDKEVEELHILGVQDNSTG